MKKTWKLRHYVSLMVALSSYNIVAEENTKDVFTEIYDGGLWGCNEEGVGHSGSGSTLKNAEPYMKFLEDFIQKHDIQSVVDVGCGDWEFSKHINWGKIQYTGYDVVKSVIEKNQGLHNAQNITFVQGKPDFSNLVPADLLICKDVLQHLPFEDIWFFIKKLGNYKYCLIANDINPNSMENKQITRGDYRCLDLTKPPFCLKGEKVLIYRSDCHVKQVLLVQQPTLQVK